MLIGRCSSRSRRADTLQRELRIRSVNLRRDIETASAAGATSVALTQSRSAQASGDDRRRLQRSAIQRSAQRLGELSLELVHPTRVARSVSARRFDTGRLAPVVRATALGTVVKAGFMTKVVPSFVGKSMRRYFVLFSADSTAMLAFYDEQKDPPESATCLGKAELGKIESVERKRLPRYPQLADHGLLLTFSSRAVAWELDAGDEANQGAWEEAINVERSRLSSVGSPRTLPWGDPGGARRRCRSAAHGGDLIRSVNHSRCDERTTTCPRTLLFDASCTSRCALRVYATHSAGSSRASRRHVTQRRSLDRELGACIREGVERVTD